MSTRILKFSGHKYLMRDQRPKAELLRMWERFHEKFPKVTFDEWLNRGKIYLRVD